MYKFDLDNKVVVITGVGNDKGLGYAMAKAYAQERCKLVLADIMPLETIKALGDTLKALGAADVLAVQCDVSSEQATQELAAAAFEKFGCVDVLVNNAGVMRVAALLDGTAKDWDLHYNVMLKGTFLCTKAFAQLWIDKGQQGRIINMSSVGGKRPWIYSSPYCACKAGIVSLTQSSAVALAPHGILVNGIAPGDHKTDMLDVCYRDGAKMEGITFEQFHENALKAIPLGHTGTVEDIAYMALYLSSGMADFITGQVMNVNGGTFLQ